MVGRGEGREDVRPIWLWSRPAAQPRIHSPRRVGACGMSRRVTRGTLVGVAGFVLALPLCAVVVPARSVSTIQPMRTLRDE